jgi:hypothetical protein
MAITRQQGSKNKHDSSNMITSLQVTVFSVLPEDIMFLLLISHLSGTEGLNLLYTSKSLFLLKASLWKNEDWQRNHPLRKLLSYVALGELDAAKILWTEIPSLLTGYGTVYHPNRSYVDDKGDPLSPPIDIPFMQNPGSYKYKGTPYQILLRNSEFEVAEEAGKLMASEENLKQFNEVFPDGKIIKYNFDLEEAKKLLQAVFEAIAKDECLKIERDKNYNIKKIIMSDATREALYKLYAYAKPKSESESEHEIGLVFDPEFYHEALKLYDMKCGQFKQKEDRYTFWNICVEEWLAGCLGTRFRRPHSQGLGNPESRVGCVLADGSSYLAFRRPSGSIPGSHFFVGYYGAGRCGAAGELRGCAGEFLELMSSSNESRDRLYAAICKPKNIVMSNSLE